MKCRTLAFTAVAFLAASTFAEAPKPETSPFGYALVAQQPDALPANVLHRLGKPRIHQPGGIASIAVSPNGRWMATGDRAGTNQVYVWDLQTGVAKWILRGHVQWVARLEF